LDATEATLVVWQFPGKATALPATHATLTVRADLAAAGLSEGDEVVHRRFS
jgi:hypothetical protein